MCDGYACMHNPPIGGGTRCGGVTTMCNKLTGGDAAGVGGVDAYAVVVVVPRPLLVAEQRRRKASILAARDEHFARRPAPCCLWLAAGRAGSCSSEGVLRFNRSITMFANSKRKKKAND